MRPTTALGMLTLWDRGVWAVRRTLALLSDESGNGCCVITREKQKLVAPRMSQPLFCLRAGKRL